MPVVCMGRGRWQRGTQVPLAPSCRGHWSSTQLPGHAPQVRCGRIRGCGRLPCTVLKETEAGPLTLWSGAWPPRCGLAHPGMMLHQGVRRHGVQDPQVLQGKGISGQWVVEDLGPSQWQQTCRSHPVRAEVVAKALESHRAMRLWQVLSQLVLHVSCGVTSPTQARTFVPETRS